jgi:hypothetical protein
LVRWVVVKFIATKRNHPEFSEVLKHVKVIFYHVLSDSQQNIALLEGSQASSACRSGKE